VIVKGTENQEVYVTFSPLFERIWMEAKKRLADSGGMLRRFRRNLDGPVGKLPVPSFTGIQFLRHEKVLVSDRMIFQRPKYSVPELFVKWSGFPQHRYTKRMRDRFLFYRARRETFLPSRIV
jgi:hypothetical protein